MRYLLNLLGNPQNKYPTVHIGGTSGKGSTSYLIAKVLQDSGYKTGLHISPHLQVATERMQVNGLFATEDEFVQLINYLKPFVPRVKKGGKWDRPSYFELLLAASFLYFAQKAVDVAVVEVGLGGRFDGTSVISPVLVILTNVGLDHTHILGNTVEKITLDKREIIKPRVPVITGARQKSVQALIKNKAKVVGAPLTIIDTRRQDTLSGLRLSLPGDYQKKNAVLALAAAKALRRIGFKRISRKSIKRALGSSFFAGRMETVSQNPLIILDGAHNPAKMHATVKGLKNLTGGFYVIFAATEHKDVKGMLRQLLPISKKLFITKYGAFTDMGKIATQQPGNIIKSTKHIISDVEYQSAPDAKRALEAAIAECDLNDKILVTGSLYLVGEIRNIFYPQEEILRKRRYR